MTAILTICTGNICRSPMAEALLRDRLPGASVLSAGTRAVVGSGAHPFAVQLLQERGIDLTGHVARQMTKQLCVSSDLILTMTAAQQSHVVTAYPETRGRVFRIGNALKVDVPDPIGGPVAQFAHALTLIEQSLDYWTAHMKNAMGTL